MQYPPTYHHPANLPPWAEPVIVHGGKFKPKGKILFWAKVKKDEISGIKRRHHFFYIFSEEEAIKDILKEEKWKMNSIFSIGC